MRSFAQRHSVLAYFLLTFALSWTGALIVAAPALMRGARLSKNDGIFMFPVMILGPCIAGIVLTRLLHGSSGVRRLFSRMRLQCLRSPWVLSLAVPPLLVWIVLTSLSRFVSAQFTPNLFWPAVFFGVPAGFLEEIGWTGFALHRLLQSRGLFPGSVLVGIVWGVWHLPAIDYLGAATPHGSYLLPFFLAFAAALTGLRVLIAWVYLNTESLLLAQLIHTTSTGALVAFSPPAVTAAAEALWYSGYAVALWAVVAALLLSQRRVRARGVRSLTAAGGARDPS